MAKPSSVWPGGVSPPGCDPSWILAKINPVLAEPRTYPHRQIDEVWAGEVDSKVHSELTMLSSTNSSWKMVPSDIPQGLILGPVLFNIFIKLDDGTKCLFLMFSDHIKLGGVAGTTEGCATIQRDLDMLEKWSDGSLVMFNKEKCKVLHLGRNSQCRLVACWLQSSFAEKSQGVLFGTMIQ